MQYVIITDDKRISLQPTCCSQQITNIVYLFTKVLSGILVISSLLIFVRPYEV